LNLFFNFDNGLGLGAYLNDSSHRVKVHNIVKLFLERWFSINPPTQWVGGLIDWWWVVPTTLKPEIIQIYLITFVRFGNLSQRQFLKLKS
jgi:hypothetical protein